MFQLFLLTGCLIALSLGFPFQAEAGEGVATKFERDLESLFGASISTKHGDMVIRQRKDSSGRVRKQIIAGPSFSEIQIDQDGDGTVDFWEITRAEKTVSASQPSRGRFLRMNVTERSGAGTFEAFYVLGKNGRRYNLLRMKHDGANRQMFSESIAEPPESFDATDMPNAPSVAASASSPAVRESTAQERFELEEQSWREYQSKLWGPDLLCVSDESSSGRLASLQREWWKILKRDTDSRVDRLTAKLKDSKMFDASCRKAGREKDFEKIAKSLSELMMTSSKGEPSTDRKSGGYLRCLEQSGLGSTVARIEQNFLSGLNDPYRAEHPISCEYKPGNAGIVAKPAYANHTSKQIVMHMCLADEVTGKSKTADGSTQTYKNVLFHELIHIAGVESEAMTHAAQACCGDSSNDSVKACAKLDKIVAEERRFAELEAFLARDEKMVPLLAELNAKFDAQGTADLYRQFLLGLDKYKRGAPPAGIFETGLISNEEFSKCVKTSSETACREQWVRHIASYADDFFKRDCKKVVVGASRSQCSKMTSEFKSRLATTIAHSMIQLQSDRDPSNPQQCKIELNEKWIGSRTARLLSRLLSFAHAIVDVDCETGIVIPSAPPLDMVIKSPTFSVPGAGDNETVVSRPGGDSSIGSRPPGPATPIRNTETSPLPVTNVTSPDSGRTVAERSYQRATDFAGAATRGLDDLRDSIVPRAVAANRGSAGAVRLDGKESFVAFRPTRSDLKAINIDNPFAGGRAVASLASNDPTMKLGSTGSTNGSTKANLDKAGEPALSVASRDSAADGKSNLLSSKSAGAGGRITKGANGQLSDNLASTPENGRPAGESGPSAAKGKNSSVREPAQAAKGLLDGLFSKRYREIEGRLNDLNLHQLLIDRGIKVINSEGRFIGAKKTIKACYKYVGQELPLKTPCEN